MYQAVVLPPVTEVSQRQAADYEAQQTLVFGILALGILRPVAIGPAVFRRI